MKPNGLTVRGYSQIKPKPNRCSKAQASAVSTSVILQLLLHRNAIFIPFPGTGGIDMMDVVEIIGSGVSNAFHLPPPHRFPRIPTGMLFSSPPSPISYCSFTPKVSPRPRPRPRPRPLPRLIFTTPCAVLENSSSDSVAAKAVEYDLSLAIKKRALEISPELKGTSIFLVGIRSCYKLSVGRILADALRYYYFDSDSLVEEAAGGKMPAISYMEKDKEGYLASETEVLKQLSSMGRLVVCAGNEAVKSTTNLALLRHGISIWIDVPLDLVAKEITGDRIQFSVSDMPVCSRSSEVQAQLTALYNSAKSGYSTADATVSLQKVASQLHCYDVDAVTTEDLCLEVLKEIERLVRVKKMMEEASRPF